jgi:hypothetical protein
MEAALVNLRFLHLPPEAAKPSVRSAWPFFDAARLVLSSDGAPPAALPWRVRKKAAKPASLARHVTVAKRLGIRSATTGQRNSTRVRSAVARPCRIPTPGKSPPGKSRTDAANHDAPADKSTDNTGKTDKTERCTPQRLALKNPLPEGSPQTHPRCRVATAGRGFVQILGAWTAARCESYLTRSVSGVTLGHLCGASWGLDAVAQARHRCRPGARPGW